MEKKLTLNLSREVFIFSNQVVILRPVIDSEGIRKDPSKVKAATHVAELEELD